MTTRKFTPTYKTGPTPVAGEITLEAPEELGVEVEQKGWQKFMFPMMAVLMLLMIGVTIYMGGIHGFSIRFLMMPLMMIMVAGGVMASSAGSNSKSIPEFDADRSEYLRYLTTVRKRVATSAKQQIAFYGYHGPHTDDLPGLIGKTRQWSRQPPTPDKPSDFYMAARIGTGSVPAEDQLLRPSTIATDPATPQLVGPSAAPAPYLEPVTHMWLVKFLRTHSLVHDCPVLRNFGTYPTVSIGGGDGTRAAALLRALICQLALFHAPDTLQIRVLTDHPNNPDWAWLKWLPHTHHATETTPSGPLRLFYPNNDEYLGDLTSRAHHLPDNKPSGPYVIVVNLDGSSTYPLDGRAGVTYITLGPTKAQYQLSIAADGTLSEASRRRSPDRKPGWQRVGTVDTMTVAAATTFARRLAKWSVTGTQLPTNEQARPVTDTGWLTLVGAKTVEDLAPERWTEYPEGSRDRLRLPIGHDKATGDIVDIDIKEGAEYGIGPHGLLIGTTGSGKSEFLRTLLLSAFALHHPNQFTAMLVDFKGGTSFLGMQKIPHVVGFITDMQEEAELVERFVDSLQGEITRRKELLRKAHEQLGVAVGDVGVYEKLRQGGADIPPIPALFVVIDEFAELMTAHPNFIEPLQQITIAGRAFRVHLLLATQAITTHVTNQIAKLEVNIGYRIALRTASVSESKAVINSPEAHYIKKEEIGTGYLRTDPDEDPTKFYTTFTGNTYNPAEPAQPDTEHTNQPTPTSTPAPTAAVGPFTPATATTRTIR